MQEQKTYYKTIFTLKIGQQIEILTEVPYENVLKLDDTEMHLVISLDDGFIEVPLSTPKSIRLAPKSIKVTKKEVAAIESTLIGQELDTDGEGQ